MTVLRIDSQALKSYFGTKDKFDALIEAYKTALERHSHTVNKPAPVAHPLVERIVRESDGLYEIVQIPEEELVDYDKEIARRKPITEPEPEKLTFEKLQLAKRQELHDRRYARQDFGVHWGAYRFSGDLYTTADLVSALYASEDVPSMTRTADGEYVELKKVNMQDILDAIVLLTRQTYQNEKRLSELIDNAKNEKALEAIDLGAGWP